MQFLNVFRQVCFLEFAECVLLDILVGHFGEIIMHRKWPVAHLLLHTLQHNANTHSGLCHDNSSLPPLLPQLLQHLPTCRSYPLPLPFPSPLSPLLLTLPLALAEVPLSIGGGVCCCAGSGHTRPLGGSSFLVFVSGTINAVP